MRFRFKVSKGFIPVALPLLVVAVAIAILNWSFRHHVEALHLIDEQSANFNARRTIETPVEIALPSSPDRPTALTENGEPELDADIDPRGFERGKKVSDGMNLAAAERFFAMTGLRIRGLDLNYQYDLSSTSERWLILSGWHTTDRRQFIVAAARVKNRDEILQLIDGRWGIAPTDLKPIETTARVRGCARCEFVSADAQDRHFTGLIGRNAEEPIWYVIAIERGDESPKTSAKQLAARVTMKPSDGF